MTPLRGYNHATPMGLCSGIFNFLATTILSPLRGFLSSYFFLGSYANNKKGKSS